jgi:hypothetical protein
MLIRTFLLGCIVASAGCAVTLPEVGSSQSPATVRDSDHDGVVDASDRCPESRETDNGHNDHDGCRDVPRSQRGLVAPGIVVVSLGGPLLITGIEFTLLGLSGPGSSGDDMHAGFERIGIPLLAAAVVHFAIGIPMIVAGALDKHWSDDGTEVVGSATSSQL